MVECLRAWDTVAIIHSWRREIVSLIPDRGTIVGRVFSPTKQLVPFSHLNVPSFKILNLFGMLSTWGSSNYRPSAPFLYAVASHVKHCHFDFGEYYYYYFKNHCIPKLYMVRVLVSLVPMPNHFVWYTDYRFTHTVYCCV